MIKILSNIMMICVLSASLNACVSRTDSAPVSDVSMIEPLPKNGIYHAGTGETLYSIAWRYGLDYRDLAKRNHLAYPYVVHAGQIIYLRGYNAVSTVKPALAQARQPTQSVTPAPPSVATKPAALSIHAPAEQEPHQMVSFWRWPAHGPVVSVFSSVNKGINIAGCQGDPIFATAAGKIVYSGHGLRGYGNLIIIKHNNKFLSAYAHNKTLLVKEGDWVISGQKIAEMGNTGTHRTLLHFEIRRNGQPVNPFIYLTHKV